MPDDLLDQHMPEPLRAWVEQRYYAQVNAQARFEALIHNHDFWRKPEQHVGLFSDHGVVHVRDVARQIVQVLEVIHGLLIPARPPARFDGFMKGYGVSLAYLHDIGMTDFSAVGRAMHPEFAAQAVFSPDLDELIGALWDQGCGGMRGRLEALAAAGALAPPPATVLRELLALAMAHSKSKVPIATLNDRPALRAVMQQSVATDLGTLYRRQKGLEVAGAPLAPDDARRAALRRRYADLAHDSFRWLVDDRAEARDLADDVVDTLRALRSADALRQRGTVQKTSGGYEVFISQQTGGAVYALRLGSDQLYLLETRDQMSAGEANIASTEVDRAGNLRISFHRGAFASQAALAHAADSTATIVQDIRTDVIESFRRPPGALPPGLKPAEAIEIWLESTDDNPGFVDLVCAALHRISPADTTRVDIVPSLTNLPERERSRYLATTTLDWDLALRRDLLERMAQSGSKTDSIDPEAAFRHVRLAQLRAGETLIEAGAPASMVYVPLGDGLKIIPLGGYAAFSVQAWMPLGNTGVIRGALRNASVIAEAAVDALMIPKDVYLRHWHFTYTDAELRARLGGASKLSS